MHSVSVCPCLSETVLAHTFCMWLHCFDMLSCPAKQMKTASSSSWGGSRMSFFNSKYLFVFLKQYCFPSAVQGAKFSWVNACPGDINQQ